MRCLMNFLQNKVLMNKPQTSFEAYRGLYIHIPFCASRCSYCDFETTAVSADDPALDAYVTSLLAQISRHAQVGELAHIETIYIGGGTPTNLGRKRLSRVLHAVSDAVELGSLREWTVEANPESLSEDILADFQAFGVNRVSLGVQSFHDTLLSTLGRTHSASRAYRAIECACAFIKNVSIDLICGIPNQSTEAFAADVYKAFELGVTHASIYPLMIEPGTPLYSRVERGDFPEPDDDRAAYHMTIAAQLFREAGFARYEVASYARPGFACRHNCSYWTGVSYLGIGRSAVTMKQNDSCRMRIQDGVVVDKLNRVEREAEDLMLGMRMSCGISKQRLERARIFLPRLDDVIGELETLGLIERCDGRVCPTERGWLCGNELYGRLMHLA